MTNEEKKELQKQEILQMLDFVKNQPIKFDSDSKSRSFLEERIAEIFRLEMEEMGLKFNYHSPESENDIILRFIDDKNVTYNRTDV